MGWLRRILHVEPPPPTPDISETLTRMQESRVHVAAVRRERQVDVLQTRREQRRIRARLRTNPLADDFFGRPPA